MTLTLLLLVGVLLVPSEGLSLVRANLTEVTENLPEPHIVILGPTGVGKSSLANVLIGQSPGCDNCTFEICSGTDSCTKETNYAVGQFNGVGPKFTIVDTPGFGDSDNDDNELIDEMTTVLKNVVKTANTLYLMFNGKSERFDANAQQMIREMEALFGKDNFWNHTVLGVSFWGYSEQDQTVRNKTGKNEEWWVAEMNRQLHEKFHVEFDLPAVFIDSWAKQDFNLDDTFQQEAYDRETSKLWNLTMGMATFEFKTIENVLGELAQCRSTLETEIAALRQDITSVQNKTNQNTIDITDLNTGLEQNSHDIINMKDNITANSNDIVTLSNDSLTLETEIADLKLDVTSAEKKIDQNTIDIVHLNFEQGQNSDDILVIKSNITSNGELIAVNTNGLMMLSVLVDKDRAETVKFINESAPPLGTILPWTFKPSKSSNHSADIPAGWQPCDGGLITVGVWKGFKTPDLNNGELFLRGSSELQKVLDIEEDSFQDHSHVDTGHTHQDSGHAHTMNPHSHGINDVFNRKPGNPVHITGHIGHGEYFNAMPLTTQDATGTMQNSKANIQSAMSGMGKVAPGHKMGAETRPKNMRVLYIIRIFK